MLSVTFCFGPGPGMKLRSGSALHCRQHTNINVRGNVEKSPKHNFSLFPYRDGNLSAVHQSTNLWTNTELVGLLMSE